jgi:hypothetical protein
MRVIDDVGTSGLKQLPAQCYAPPVDFRVDVERSLKEASAVETVLPEWQEPDDEQAELEAAAAATSRRLASKALREGWAFPKPKPKSTAKQQWRQRVALDHAIAEERLRYGVALVQLQEHLSNISGIESGLCCVPSRAQTLERAAIYAEYRKVERYLWECERP